MNKYPRERYAPNRKIASTAPDTCPSRRCIHVHTPYTSATINLSGVKIPSGIGHRDNFSRVYVRVYVFEFVSLARTCLWIMWLLPIFKRLGSIPPSPPPPLKLSILGAVGKSRRAPFSPPLSLVLKKGKQARSHENARVHSSSRSEFIK